MESEPNTTETVETEVEDRTPEEMAQGRAEVLEQQKEAAAFVAVNSCSAAQSLVNERLSKFFEENGSRTQAQPTSGDIATIRDLSIAIRNFAEAAAIYQPPASGCCK